MEGEGGKARTDIEFKMRTNFTEDFNNIVVKPIVKLFPPWRGIFQIFYKTKLCLHFTEVYVCTLLAAAGILQSWARVKTGPV